MLFSIFVYFLLLMLLPHTGDMLYTGDIQVFFISWCEYMELSIKTYSN